MFQKVETGIWKGQQAQNKFFMDSWSGKGKKEDPWIAKPSCRSSQSQTFSISSQLNFHSKL